MLSKNSVHDRHVIVLISTVLNVNWLFRENLGEKLEIEK